MSRPTPCGKRSFASASAARRANAKARFRIRAYFCERCHAYHVANQDKRR
jgi:hypothetical protein